MTRAKWTNRLIASIALLVVSVPGYAEVSPAIFSPATFGNPEAENAITKFLEFPQFQGDVTAKMACAVIAVHNGKLKDNACFLENEFDRPFAEAMFKASKKARLVPATIDEREKTVYFQYRVEFTKKGEDHTVRFLPNPGVNENIEEYGNGHFAAQRLVGRERWQKSCPQRKRYLVYVRAHVNAQGQVSNISLSHGGGIVPPVACQNAIFENVAESGFIPAFADGVPVPSTFVEPFSN